jgi:dienelactone hydrolase
MQDFSEFSFEHKGITHPVYYKGSGAAIVIMHELPGMNPQCLDFARRIAAEGFTVFLPLMFGKPNEPFSIPTSLRFTAQLCLSREFYMFAKHQSSPITEWLRALCRDAYARCDRQGVGVVGMCLTGGFVLSLMADEVVTAPVMGEPSLPFGITKEHRAALGISPAELEIAKQRSAQGIQPIGFRFSEDKICPAERFATLRQEFGDTIELHEIDSSKGNPYGNPPIAHSVFTVHFVDQEGHPTRQALDRILKMFKERLG